MMEDALTLSEILLNRRKVITEQELWALCRECALTLEYVQNQSDIYEGLCVTPETVAFDQTGSVCFLDLGTEPDSFFLPPEYENGNLSKVQLFSLGMTLLYAVDHDDDPDHKPTLSQHFTDLLSQLTADEETLRPTLETVIAQCEQVLAGQSSQDICLHFSTLTPSPDHQEGDSSILDLTSGLTAYLQSQTGIVNQSPELESPEADRDFMNSRNSKDSEMSYLDKNQNVKHVKSIHSGNTDHDSRISELKTGSYMSPVTSSEGSPRRSSDHRTSASRINSNPSSVHSSREEPLVEGSDKDRTAKHGSSSDGCKHKSSRGGSNPASSGSSRGSSRGSNKGSSRNSVEPSGDQNGSSVPNSPSKRRSSMKEDSLQNGSLSGQEYLTSTPNSSCGLEDNQKLASPSKEAKKKPSVTISDIIELLDRYLKEKELWALCREGVLALQRKKKHLPAYISPDTVVVRGDGSVTFKAIPEDKPLEVIFMAPELQQKGVLSEKTCLYGLGISLRCAAGQKYSTSLALQVSHRFEALLLALLQPSPEKRPSLQDTLQLCDDHETEGHPPSKISCLEMYDTATNINNSSSHQHGSSSHHSTPVKHKPQKYQPPSLPHSAPPSLPPPAPLGDEDEVVSEEELNLAYVPEEEEEDLGYDVEDDQDDHGLEEYEESFVDEPSFTNSSPMGFKPVAKSASNSISGSPSSAFKPVSFKPVPSSLTDGVRVPSAFSSQATHFKPIVLHGHPGGAQSSDTKPDSDIKKENEVMRKLKELESELSRSRKMEHAPEKEQKENSSQEGVNSNPLESLLHQLQSQGQMPNTQSLASAIAQHLKSQSGPSTSPESNSVSPPQVHQPILGGQTVPVQQMVPQAPYPAMMNTGQTYPLPSHGILEQTHSFPLQYGGMIPSYPPLQMQLQQDPRTGLMGWVPVLPYQSPPASVALGSSLPVSPEFYRNSSSNPSQNYSGYSSDAHSNPNRSDLSESVNNEEPPISPFRSRGPSSASSTKSAQEHSSPQRVPVTQSPSDGYTSESASLRRPQSDLHANHSPMRERHSVGNFPAHDHRGHLTNESRSSPHIRHFQSSMKQLSVPSVQGSHPDHQGATSPQRMTNQSIAGAPHDDPSASQTSSPSPSKDSGVSGVHAPVRTYPHPSSDASLMERLLSPESLHRQRVQGRVLQLVREEQGFDMLFEQNAEDCAMAEYIASLANLKWETFVSAITEKYSELYWGNELLGRLFDTINSYTSPQDQQNSLTERNPPTPPARCSSYVVTENMNRERSENRDWSESASHQSEALSVSHQPRHTDNMYVKHNRNTDRKDPRFGDRSNRYPEQGDRKSFSLPNKPKIVTISTFSPRGGENQRSQSACQRFIGSSTISETSDSTDTEMREKKRRYKKRYELDRAKSSSMHNLSSGAMLSVPETRRSDSYLVSSNVDTDFLSQGETTPVNCSTPHEKEDHLNSAYPDSLAYHRNEYNERSMKLQGDRPHLPQHSHSIQERYSVQSNRPPPRKTVSLSPTPLPNYSSSWAAPLEEYKYNSLPRDAFKRQKTSSVEHRASYSFQQFDSSRQPVLDRKQEISHRVGQNRDQLNLYVSNKGNLGSKSSESDSETNFRDNVRRTTAKIMQQNSDRLYKDDKRNSYHGNGNVREKVSQVKQQKESQPKQRGSSLSSLPTEGSTKPSDPANGQTVPVYSKTDQVVYHWAAIQLNMSSEVEAFIQEIEQEEDNKSLLERRLTAVNQQLCVQKKERKTSQKFYRKLTEPAFRSEKGVDQKTSQVLKNLSEMTKKIRFLELCKAHLQMLLSELHGLDPSYLYSLLALPDNRPLVLQPYTDNPTLQFQGVREPHTGCEVQVLFAGEPKGLMAYLFTASALSDGYIHQFLYTFRYFLTPEQLLDFIRTRYIASSRSSQSDSNIVRVMNRAVDLLHFWIEGFFSVDFERNLPLTQRLEAFVREYVNQASPESGSSLRHLLQVCRHGPPSELLGDTIGGDGEEDRTTCFVHLETSKKKSRAEMLDEWDSFRSSTKVKVTPKHRPSLPDLSIDLEKFRMARSMLDITKTTALTRGRADAFSILDYSVNSLAEQLTLMEQDLFVMTHPVHYLNSKAQGVGVAMSMPGMRTPSMQRKNREPEVTSLFVSDAKMESVIQRIISYNQELSHWVAAEIVTCTSSKTQCAIMTAFIQLAQLCGEIRNFSTCLAILDGLENLIVRQLPAWKNLTSKCGDIMEDLDKIKMHIKGEQNYLMKDKDSHLCPTIPSVLYFLLHVQQLEIGSFKLANEMYKWTKMRALFKIYCHKVIPKEISLDLPQAISPVEHSFGYINRSISKMIDQIRIFRENEYLFEPEETLQDAIQQRILDFSDQDLHSIASTNETNFRKFTGGGLSGVFKKVKGKLQSKGEK